MDLSHKETITRITLLNELAETSVTSQRAYFQELKKKGSTDFSDICCPLTDHRHILMAMKSMYFFLEWDLEGSTVEEPGWMSAVENSLAGKPKRSTCRELGGYTTVCCMSVIE